MSPFREIFNERRTKIFDELSDFLRFESVATEPECEEPTRACAEWCRAQLENMGFQARLEETTGMPLVIGHYEVAGAPTVLFYGHYDVQPVGVLEDWISPPFEPTVRDGRIYARGAVDDKGQVFYVLKALEHLLETKQLKYSVKVVIEGEEESGSDGLSGALPKLSSELQADILMVADTGMVALDQPTIMLGLRGAAFVNLELRGANRELHSGHHGGVAPNPALEISRLLSTLVDANGKIQVEGYYDDVFSPSEELLDKLSQVPFDPSAYAEEIGVPPVAGESEFPPVVRTGLRPTIEVNGVSSGFSGPGVKTIVPDVAFAAISSRLAFGQIPEKCLEQIEAHFLKHAPKGLQLRILHKEAAGAAVLVDPSEPAIKKAAGILENLMGKSPVYKCNGGSIPIIAALSNATGAAPLLVGFSHDSDRLHAVNESFGLDRFETGFCFAAEFLGS